jgi:hypothetical protein
LRFPEYLDYFLCRGQGLPSQPEVILDLGLGFLTLQSLLLAGYALLAVVDPYYYLYLDIKKYT